MINSNLKNWTIESPAFNFVGFQARYSGHRTYPEPFNISAMFTRNWRVEFLKTFYLALPSAHEQGATLEIPKRRLPAELPCNSMAKGQSVYVTSVKFLTVPVAYAAGVRKGRERGFRAQDVPLLPSSLRAISRPISLPLPFRTPATQATCLVARRLSLDENVPSVPFPRSLAVHHQSLASTLPKTKRLRRRLACYRTR